MDSNSQPVLMPQPEPSKKMSKGSLVGLIVGCSLLGLLFIGGLLYALIGTSYSNLQARARDTERKTDIDYLANQLEVYYAISGGYPSSSDLNDAMWRTRNTKITTMDAGLKDPLSTNIYALSPTLSSGTTGPYVYSPTPNNCSSPTDATGKTQSVTTVCSGYVLTALLENKNNSTQTTNDGRAIYQRRSVN